MASTMREQHRKHLCVFQEAEGVDQALRQQITSAIKPQYLEAFTFSKVLETRQTGYGI